MPRYIHTDHGILIVAPPDPHATDSGPTGFGPPHVELFLFLWIIASIVTRPMINIAETRIPGSNYMYIHVVHNTKSRIYQTKQIWKKPVLAKKNLYTRTFFIAIRMPEYYAPEMTKKKQSTPSFALAMNQKKHVYRGHVRGPRL